MELIDFSSSVWSIIPALLAIVLAIATRRVLVSLSAGIIVGALMLGGWNIGSSFSYLSSNVISLVYADGAINSNMNIVLFLLLLGVLTALLTVNVRTTTGAIFDELFCDSVDISHRPRKGCRRDIKGWACHINQ